MTCSISCDKLLLCAVIEQTHLLYFTNTAFLDLETILSSRIHCCLFKAKETESIWVSQLRVQLCSELPPFP